MTARRVQKTWTPEISAEQSSYTAAMRPHAQQIMKKAKIGLKDQSRSCQFTSPSKYAEKVTELKHSIVCYEELDCYNKYANKPVHYTKDDELQLLPRKDKLTPEQGTLTVIIPQQNRYNESEHPEDYLLRNKRKDWLGTILYQQ